MACPFPLSTCSASIRPAGCRDQDQDRGAFSQPRGLHHLQHESRASGPHTVLASAASFLLIEALAPPLKHRNATSTPWQRSFYSGKQSNSSPDGGFGALTARLCWIGTTCWAESRLLAGVFSTGWIWKLQQRGQLVLAKQKHTLAHANVLHYCAQALQSIFRFIGTRYSHNNNNGYNSAALSRYKNTLSPRKDELKMT